MASWLKDGGWAIAMAATMVVAGSSEAQVTAAAPSATPTPLPGITPGASAPSRLPIPPAPVIILPTASPSSAPTPHAAPIPRATPTPKPTAGASPKPRATASPTPRRTPSPTPAVAEPAPPVATPASPAVAASPTPVVATSQSATTAETSSGFVLDDWPIPLAVIGAVLLLAIGWVVLRRRRARQEEFEAGEDYVGYGEPVDPTPARARLALTFRPIRAGLNLLSAVSENEVVLANIGDAPAEDIRLLTQLGSAHTGQDADLAAIYAAPIFRPAVPVFSLAPGEERAITSVAALPRDAIRTLTAAGRPMFVPLVAVNVLYTSGAVAGQFAQAFAVGVERVDSAKLAPFWLDVPPRTVDQVAARPHAAAMER